MSLRRFILHFFAAVLLLTFPSMRIATVSHSVFALPIQNYLSQQEQYTAEGKPQKAVYLQAKTLQELLPLTTGIELLPALPPLASNLWGCASEPLLQEIAREIFIPPENPV